MKFLRYFENKNFFDEEEFDFEEFDEEDWDIKFKLYCDDKGISLSVTELWINNKGFKSLKGLNNFTNLYLLFCPNNQLTDIEGLDKLKNLEKLYCYNNNFSEEYKDYIIEYCRNNHIELSIREHYIIPKEGLRR